jgi:hypothetical protein
MTTRISQLPVLTGADSTGSDLVPVVDVSPTSTTKRMTRTEFFRNTPSLYVGHAPFASPLDAPLGVAAGVGAGIGSYRFSANTFGSDFRFAKSRSATIGVNEAVLSGDVLGSINFFGADGADYIPSAIIRASVDGDPGVADMPGRLTFATTADGASAVTERMRITSAGNVGIGTTTPAERLSVSGNVTITGSLSKGSGSFKIDHPLKPETHHLVHSFVEAPQADNIYRGRAVLVAGMATVNLDAAGRMSDGTFAALNGNVQCFTSNETGWTAVRGSVSGNVLTIEAQDPQCTDTVSWLVIGERHDQHMLDANWTGEDGRVIVEPEKVQNDA